MESDSVYSRYLADTQVDCFVEEEVSVRCRVLGSQDLQGGVERGEEGNLGVAGMEGPQL